MIIKMIIIYIPARQTGPKKQENARFSLLLLLLFWLPQWLSITLCQLREDRWKLRAKLGLSFVIDTHNRLKIDWPTYLMSVLKNDYTFATLDVRWSLISNRPTILFSCLMGLSEAERPRVPWLLLIFGRFGPNRSELDADWRFESHTNDSNQENVWWKWCQICAPAIFQPDQWQNVCSFTGRWWYAFPSEVIQNPWPFYEKYFPTSPLCLCRPLFLHL